MPESTKDKLERSATAVDTLDTLSPSTTARISTRPASRTVERGTLLGRYVVLSKVGAGSMGVVLAAYDPDLDRKVAIKLLEAGAQGSSVARTRLQREAQALAKLDHRNVVSVYDVGVDGDDGQLFMAMEFVEGQTLDTWMRALESPRPWPEALRVFIDAGRGEQSGALMDLRMACLDDRRSHLRARVNELARADEATVNHAVRSVLGLPGLDRCADADALRAEIPPPEEPELAAQVEGLDAQLVEVLAKHEAGSYEQGLALAEAVAKQALALAYEPLKARALVRLGGLQRESGEYAEAVVTLEGELDEARAYYEQALALREQALGPEHPFVATSLNNLGNVAERAGSYALARSYLERALALYEQALGPEHPDVATALMNLGNVVMFEGKPDEARRHWQRALEIREQALGPEHHLVSSALNNLGNLAASSGEFDEARRHWQRALAIRERALGSEHPEVGATLNNLGVLARLEGDYALARAHQERALAIKEKAWGREHPEVAISLNNLALVVQLEGDREQARAYHERALAIRTEAFGPEHPTVAGSLTNLAALAKLEGKLDEAVALYERALAIRSASEGDPADLAALRFTLAQVLWDIGGASHRARARELAGLAREHYENTQASGEALAAIEAWLDERETN